ncbi:MAG TPA: hypothetical protein VGM44_17700, partial [Polyangiaceae bacterium]
GSGESGGKAGAGGNGNPAGAGGAAGRTGSGGTGTTGGTTTGGSAAAGTTGSGGTGAAAGSGGTTATTELIDDFEDRDLVLLMIKKRNGPWYAFNDGSKTDSQTFGIALLTDADARSGSSSTAGLHMTAASGFTGFGAGFGADFVNTQAKKVAYDVSAYKGVRFYAKIGSGAQSAMKVLFPTTYSDPMGGKCNDAVAMMGCNDHLFELVTSITTTWAVYEVDFSDLTQQGFGLPQASLDPTSVYSVQFTLSTAAFPADVWLDDISFVLK